MTAHRAGPQSPIGVFDSGVGGLTVVRALQATLPAESILYLGDTARLPYGTKSEATVTEYTRRNLAFLEARGVLPEPCAAKPFYCRLVDTNSLRLLRQDGRSLRQRLSPLCKSPHSSSISHWALCSARTHSAGTSPSLPKESTHEKLSCKIRPPLCAHPA
mgnify:CR=1 FL=1